MSNPDYLMYVEGMLLAIADTQVGPNIVAVDVEDIHRRLFQDSPPTWVQTIVGELERRGFGRDEGTLNARYFRINGAGLAQASAIRKGRQPKSLVQKLTGETSQKLINVLNFGVALLALIVAALALMKA